MIRASTETGATVPLSMDGRDQLGHDDYMNRLSGSEH